MEKPKRNMCIVLLGTLFFQQFMVGAQDFSQLQGEFWVEKQPMGSDGPVSGLTVESTEKLALEEMSHVFSGIIYGFTFTYRPLDINREVKELFTLEPIGKIMGNAQSVELRESREDEGLRYYRFRYVLNEHETARLEALASAGILNGGAESGANFFQGHSGKIEAIKSAIKEAIRAHSRKRMQNKPAWLAGRVYLEDVPGMKVEHGEYRAKVKVKILIEDTGAYEYW